MSSSLVDLYNPASAPDNRWLEELIKTQREMQEPELDQDALKTRYLFVPFADRELPPDHIALLGGYTMLMAGRILPFPTHQIQETDDKVILEVPRDPEGNFLPIMPGLHRMKLTRRTAKEDVQMVFDVYNQHHEIDGPQNNGICEIELLRGSDDMQLLFALNQHCLPNLYPTARLQMEQLKRAQGDAPSGIYAAVAGRLLKATERASRWALWHYGRLESAMENPQRSGKWDMSPLDLAVCRWVERPEPRRRSNLVTTGMEQTSQAAPVRRTIQCFDCGAEALLLPDGAQPKKGCVSCGSVTFGREAQAQTVTSEAQKPAQANVATVAEQTEMAKSLGELPTETKTEREQREARERSVQAKRR